jgi:hypothetical protein
VSIDTINGENGGQQRDLTTQYRDPTYDGISFTFPLSKLLALIFIQNNLYLDLGQDETQNHQNNFFVSFHTYIECTDFISH